MFESIMRAAFCHKGVTEDSSLILIKITVGLGVTVGAWLAAYVIRFVGLT
jgi:hypothetical protein